MNIKSSEDKEFESEAKKCRDWLVPLGYIEVYRNHPLEKEREIHFSKQGVRVAFIYGKFGHKPHCQLIYTIMYPVVYEIRTMRYEILCPDIVRVHDDLRKTFIELTKKSLLKRLISKLNRILRKIQS